ncbi:hypothetical protein IMG5_138590, partial [Ichthyophthirius multifiliis]
CNFNMLYFHFHLILNNNLTNIINILQLHYNFHIHLDNQKYCCFHLWFDFLNIIFQFHYINIHSYKYCIRFNHMFHSFRIYCCNFNILFFHFHPILNNNLTNIINILQLHYNFHIHLDNQKYCCFHLWFDFLNIIFQILLINIQQCKKYIRFNHMIHSFRIY